MTPAHRALLISAVREAARTAILPRFRNLAAGEVRTKSGPADLVTEADIEAEALIAARVSAGWPEAEVLGEESVARDHGLRARMDLAEWAVVVDPVDGTWNFAKGLAVFGVILAVLHHGKPVYGLIYDPLGDDWVEAVAGGGATIARADQTPRAIATSGASDRRRLTGYVATGLFPHAKRAPLFATFADFARVTSLRCSAHEYRMVAQGHVDFVLSGPVPHPWDHAAGVLAVIEAGGVARFIDGAPYDSHRHRGVILAAGSEALWQDLAALYAPLV